jgi:uncharacterized repeat protein (TIGR03803 family)
MNLQPRFPHCTVAVSRLITRWLSPVRVRFCVALLFCMAIPRVGRAQTFTTLQSFDGTDGRLSYASLVQATNGILYGTTYYGGAKNSGQVFEITTGGALSTVYSFCSKTGCGEYTYATPVQGTDGNLYGTTYSGGASDDGTVFKLTPSGTLTMLHTFGGSDGSQPLAELVQANNGDFYGTTYVGGSEGKGEVFKITRSGALTTLHSFCSQSGCTDGENPFAGLIQGVDGNLYGTTFGGGTAKGFGTVFKITPSGTLTTLHSFCTQSGCPDGQFPQTGLVQATNGNLYGTTISGGAYGDGTIFKITTSGTLTTLYNVCSQSGCPDGQYPGGGLVQDTNGNLYGTTADGGANGEGTIFSLSLGLSPSVEAQPASGIVGAVIKILGTNLTGATSVAFNGTAATFTVVSSSEITTTVPAGGTTGTIQVATPGGPLSSNVPFTVTP